MKSLGYLITTAAIASLTATPARAFSVSIEAPTIQTEQTSGEEVFTIDFNDLTSESTDSFRETDTSTNSTYIYSEDLVIQSTNIYGGADNTTYVEPASKPSSYSVSVDNPQKYFGLWWSAGDESNILTFKKDGDVVAVFNTADVINTVGVLDNGNEYYCNPTTSYTGEVCHEPFVFINFYFNEEGQSYDEIVFEATAAGGNFESDNHTFSVNAQTPSGTPVTHTTPTPDTPIVFAD